MDEVVMTDYGQLDLVWGGHGFEGDFDREFDGQVNGLVGAASGMGLYLNLARRSGGSRVRVLLLERAAGDVSDRWEDVVEVSVVVPDDVPVRWSSWAGMSGGDLDLPPGSYRVRVSALGRDEGRADEFAAGVVDDYLVELWPAAPEPDAVLRTTSADGQYWHGAVGGRR